MYIKLHVGFLFTLAIVFCLYSGDSIVFCKWGFSTKVFNEKVQEKGKNSVVVVGCNGMYPRNIDCSWYCMAFESVVSLWL